MKGIIVNYHIAYTKEVLVSIPSIKTKKQAAKLFGKKVVWQDGAKYTGKVSGLHGRRGTIKVKFKAPLPAKCLAKPVEIEE